jgi:hypothetical protein
MKYSQENQQEFQIQQEDFPALPRSQSIRSFSRIYFLLINSSI